MGSKSATGRSNFKGEYGRPIVKYRDDLQWAEQKRLNRFETPFELWARMGPMSNVNTLVTDGSTVFARWRECVNTGSTYRIRLNRPCAVMAMRPVVKIRWPLVKFYGPIMSLQWVKSGVSNLTCIGLLILTCTSARMTYCPRMRCLRGHVTSLNFGKYLTISRKRYMTET